MKKAWSKPELIVLHRDKAEAVLALCKLGTSSFGPTTAVDSRCYAVITICDPCSALTGS